jgi:hydrogenase nickel incorporation protein HypA/HybF
VHELALSQTICEAARAHLHEGQRLTRVVVECGPFAGVVPEALEYCFPVAAEHLGIGDAELELRLLTADAECPACAARFAVATMWDTCPECGRGPVTARGGRELNLIEIEVEDETDV